MDGSLTQMYIMFTRNILSGKCKENKIRIRYNNIHKKENVDYETVENFCKALLHIDKRDKQKKKIQKILKTKEKYYEENEYQNEKEKKKETKKEMNYSNLDQHTDLKILDISLNNLNETNLFQIVSTVYNSLNIIGLNLKHNKITNNVFQKIVSILNENDHFNYLNIQNTDLNCQAIKTIIFYSLNKNNIKTLKLPALTLNAFQALTNNLKNNSSLEKLHFSLTTSTINSNHSNKNMENEMTNINQQLLINKFKKQYDIFLNVVEMAQNIIKIKCTTDFQDSEFDENLMCLVSICEDHKELIEKENNIKKNKIDINSAELMNLLKTDITGQQAHIPKFEKEESETFEPEVINIIEKILL